MRVNPILSNYGTNCSIARKVNDSKSGTVIEPVQSTNFKGNLGRFFGGTAGAIVGSLAGAATGFGILLPFCLYAGAKWLSDVEDEAKSNNKRPSK